MQYEYFFKCFKLTSINFPVDINQYIFIFFK